MELFRFDSATIERGDAGPILRDFTWVGHAGESWAIVGPNGCGKTTLLEALAGKHRITRGTRSIRDSVASVAFREDSQLFSPANFYYQQRFEFNEPDDCPTAREFLQAGTQNPIDAVVDQFHLAALLDLKLLKLSNGQQRRLRIAKGLLKRPALLLLDDPFSGLDTAMRAELDGHLGRLCDSGLSVVLTCRADAVPSWVSHTLVLGSDRVGRGESARPDATPMSGLAESTRPTGEPIIEMSDVTVRHGGLSILQNVNWRVHRGERWAILGPNGSGKTTLLSLLCGDHPQAFGNDTRLFGQRRGSGETIWDVKRRIGLVSPEMHQYFPRMLTAREAVASGFGDRFASEKLTDEQSGRIDELLDRFDLREIVGKRWWQLSTGAQRQLLFLRAIVKQSELLILDEPFQGLDVSAIRRVQHWLTTELTPAQTLLLVVHNRAELPAGITHTLQLHEGRVVGVASSPLAGRASDGDESVAGFTNETEIPGS